MKKILIIILGILLIYSCNSNNNAKNGKMSVLNGTINNSSDSIVVVNYSEVFDTLTLNENGNFSYLLDVDKPQYIIIASNQTNLMLYVSPKAEINFVADAYFDNVEFSGDNSDVNNYLFAQSDKLKKSKFSNQRFVANSDTETFLSELNNLVKELDAELDKLDKKNNDFIELEKQRLLLNEASLLLNNYITKIRNNSATPELEQMLNETIGKLKINDTEVVMMPEYMSFAIPYLIYSFDKKTKEENLINSDYADQVKNYFDVINETFISPEIRDELYFIIINDFISVGGVESVSEVYESYKNTSTNKKRLQQLEDVFAEYNRILPGNSAVNFSFPDIEGNMHSLSDFKGKYVYIDVWASWCGPCRQEIPKLKELKNKFKSKNIEIIGISVDDNKSNWENMVKTQGLDGVQLYAGGWNNDLVRFFKITGIPRFILIDREGNIINANAERPSGNIESVLNGLDKI